LPNPDKPEPKKIVFIFYHEDHEGKEE